MNQAFQLLWPALQLVPSSHWWHRLMRWLRRRSAPVRPAITRSGPFERALSRTLHRALKVAGVPNGLVTIELDIRGALPPRARSTVLRLARALVGDALAHNFEPGVAGRISVVLEPAIERLRLVVEDDGWAPRTARSWLDDICPTQIAAERLGGRLHRHVFWANSRIVLDLPLTQLGSTLQRGVQD